ncbi:MAG: nitroreductase family protein [Mycobacterium sp.]
MDLIEALRTTGAVREFTDQPVTDEVLARVLDNARFAPSGGNAQAWHVVVVKDQAIRRAMRDLYLPGWHDYLAMRAAGLRPWAPGNDPAAETAAVSSAPEELRSASGQGFAGEFDRVPVLLAVFANLAALAAVDRDFDRYTFAGGASIYPFAWNILLAARAEGLGGVLTTMLIREEGAVAELLGAPPGWALATVIALGHPVRQLQRLQRRPVPEFATVDRVDGIPLSTPPGPSGTEVPAT